MAKYESQQWVEMGLSLKQYPQRPNYMGPTMGQQANYGLGKIKWATLASFYEQLWLLFLGIFDLFCGHL